MKRNIALLCTAIMLLSFISTAIWASPAQGANRVEIVLTVGSSKASINGQSIALDAAPYIKSGSTLVPLRFIGTALGATIDWHQESETVTYELDGTTILLTIGSKNALVNAESKQILQAPEISNARTMVPLRFVSEALGASVDWEDATQKITIIRESEPTVPKQAEKPALLNPEAVGYNGMASAAHPLAAQAGLRVMQRGGNAIDAAVATALAIGVVEPFGSGLGGGGFAVVRLGATGNGTMTLAEVLEDSIKYAEEGFEVTAYLARAMTSNLSKLRADSAARGYYLNNGLPYQPGQVLRNPDLAKTLRAIAQHGTDAFYKGEPARVIEEIMQANGGLITQNDMAAAHASIRERVSVSYRGYEILSAGPTSSGGTLVAMILNMLEDYDLKSLGHNTTETLHLWAEASRRAFADRSGFFGDPDFVDPPIGDRKSVV